MAPTRSSRNSGIDTDMSMADVSEVKEQHADPMVCFVLVYSTLSLNTVKALFRRTLAQNNDMLTGALGRR
jgi:hypothetical protein